MTRHYNRHIFLLLLAATLVTEAALAQPLQAQPLQAQPLQAQPLQAQPQAQAQPTTHAQPVTPTSSAHAAQPATASADLGRGVTFRTRDQRFSLTVRARIQTRITVAEQTDGDQEPQTELQVRRQRLLLQGDIYGPRLTYYIQLGFSNQDTEPDLRLPLRDATVFWAPIRDLNVRFGQMKVPFGRQRVVSSSAQQMVDRSLIVGELNLDRDVGVVLFSRDLFGLGQRLQYHLGVFGGDGRNRLSSEFGLLYVGRIQVQPFGEYDDLVEADVLRLPNPRLALGFAAAYNQNSRRARSTFGDTFQRGFDYVQYDADLQFKWAGFSLQAEWIYRRATQDSHELGMNSMGLPLRESSRSGSGYYVQAGYLTASGIELGARWGELHPFGGTSSSFLRTREIGASLSWYVHRHDLKLQADHFYLADGDNFSSGRHQFRLQAQLYF